MSGIGLPGTTAPLCILCRSCPLVHRRCNPVAIPEPGSRVARKQACGTGCKGASIQPSMARFSFLRIQGLRAPIHHSPLSHLPSWALLASSLPPRSGTSKPRRALGRGSRNDVALACESFAVHWPLLRPCPCTFGTSPFLRTHCIDRPLQTLFLFEVRYQCPPFLNKPSPGLCLAPLANCPGAPANPAQPLAAAPGAIRLCLVNNPVSRSLNFSGTMTRLTLSRPSAFHALSCHFQILPSPVVDFYLSP